MRSLFVAATLLTLTVPRVGFADDARPYLPRFDFETGRVEPRKAESDAIRLEVHGEYQLRATLLSDRASD